MREDAFRGWLEANGAQTAAGRSTRLHAVRTIERRLKDLGSPADDLEAAWAADRFNQLRERLRRMREDALDGGQDYRILMPDSEKPQGRLANWSAWLAQYGRFLGGEAPGMAKDADRIRQYVLEHDIEPAREEGLDQIDVIVRDVNAALALNQAWPNICQALEGDKFLELAQVPPPERIGKAQSSATVFRFRLSNELVDRAALDAMRARFLASCPDFRSFPEPGTGWAQSERLTKDTAVQRTREAMAGTADDEALGKAVYEIMKTAAKDSPLVRWQTEDGIARNHPDLLPTFYRTIGEVVRSREDTAIVLKRAFAVFESLRAQGVATLTFGERICILFSALSMARPMAAVPLKITLFNDVWKQLTGAPLFVESGPPLDAAYRRFVSVFERLFVIMRDEWDWAPRDWLDLQGFLWIALKGQAETPSAQAATDAAPSEKTAMPPTNLILYGPPGTGKTYATAAEAVRLCGDDVPRDRDELMAAYNRLCAAKRIEFVTFHQSMSYEDFVEGRQPVTDGDNETNGTGFRLETVPGIFRRIARRAETSQGAAPAQAPLTVGERRVFKCSIGEAANPEESHLFTKAIENGYTGVGFDTIDWSDEKFASRAEIVAACREYGTPEEKLGSNSGNIQTPHIFRNIVRPGDIVVVSKGNRLFRAIGVVTGGYEFHPHKEGEYAHRRAVRWLWVDPQGTPVAEIYRRDFSMRTIYALAKEDLDIPALERYMNSARPQAEGGQAAPQPFVLIIDEINRANISKVFGELITLIEADKRLGARNQIKVRLPYSGDDFGVPANLHIVGTMNTADRSIALLDTALRRRFAFREMMPEPAVLEPAAARSGVDLPRLLATLNERIEYLFDREHLIGHAYFVDCDTRASVDAVMRYKVIPLLAEYFFEDWGKVAAVLGDAIGDADGGFLHCTALRPPPGLDVDGEAPPRHRWELRGEDEGFDYSKLLKP